MQQIRLGVSRRGPDGREHSKQEAYLDADRTSDGIAFTDLVCGRGFGKSIAAVLLAFRMAFIKLPGVPGLVTEMSDADIFDIFVDRWAQIVPGNLYELKIAQRRIVCKSNPPTTIYLRSRHVTDESDNCQKCHIQFPRKSPAHHIPLEQC